MIDVASIEPGANSVLPHDVFPGSSNATMRPVIVRESESVAVIVIGVSIFLLITTYLLPVVFRQCSLHRRD